MALAAAEAKEAIDRQALTASQLEKVSSEYRDLEARLAEATADAAAVQDEYSLTGVQLTAANQDYQQATEALASRTQELHELQELLEKLKEEMSEQNEKVPWAQERLFGCGKGVRRRSPHVRMTAAFFHNYRPAKAKDDCYDVELHQSFTGLVVVSDEYVCIHFLH